MLPVIIMLMFTIAMVVFGAVIVTVFRRAWGSYLADRRLPVMVAGATVASKNEELAESFAHNFERRMGETYDESDAVRMEPVRWFATFDCEDGETREFSVPQGCYEALIVGDRGQLAWRGRHFVGFTLPGEEKPEKTVPNDWL